MAINVSNICRTCLSEQNKQLFSIFDESKHLNNSIQLIKMLEECTSVAIHNHDQLPKVICCACRKKLELCYEFKVQCLVSQVKFQQKILNDTVKKEIQSNDTDENSIHNEDFTDDLDTNFIQLKTENQLSNDGIVDFKCNLPNSHYFFVKTDTAEDSSNKELNNQVCTTDNTNIKSETEPVKDEIQFENNITSNNSGQCNICMKTLNTTLKNHILEVHKLTCYNCYKVFPTHKQFQKHIMNYREKIASPCTECGKSFAKKYMKQHMRTHSGERPYQCSVCNKRFAVKVNLNNHMRIHTGEKPYKCAFCDIAFNQSQTLKLHMVIHTKEKRFICEVCGKALPRSSSYHTHLRTHTKEKNYQCDICNRRFGVSSTLKDHKLTHSDEKPHKCTVCNKTFRRSDHLKTHIKTHTGEKPFACTVCNRRFLQRHVLVRHMTTH